MRRVCSMGPVRNRLAPWLRGRGEVSAFSPNGAGLGPCEVLRQAHRRRSLSDATAVILGTGAGSEADLLVPFGVSRLIGADLKAHETRWPQRRAQLASRGIAATFTLMDGSRYGLRDNSVDVIFSQSVLEYVDDLDATLAEAARVLVPGGHFAAWFGPLWCTFDGPHVPELRYEHLRVDDEELIRRTRLANRGGERWEYWLEAGLLNRLRYEEYIDLLEKHFVLEWVGVTASSDGVAYRDSHPEVWSELVNSHDEVDLLISLVGVVGRPRR
jgi:SAM-dependent methyltransferase